MTKRGRCSEEAPQKTLEAERDTFARDGVVLCKGVIPAHEVASLREALEQVFSRSEDSLKTKGLRVDLNDAADVVRQAGQGDRLLLETTPKDETRPTGRFVSDLEAGRWHSGLREFELSSSLPGVVAQVIGAHELRFYGDHAFLKEPGSLLQTGFHQDAPYFPFEGELVAVCWVPVDRVTRESGAMRYVRGSHRWREYSPTSLITLDATHETRAPLLPQITDTDFDVVQFNAEPGDVIIHHPRTVHGAGGNTSERRRLAVSIRYCGEDVRWVKKATNVPMKRLTKMWAIPRETSMVREAAGYLWRRLLRSMRLAPMGTWPDHDYRKGPLWCTMEMQDGDDLGKRDSSRYAYPVVWPQACGDS